MWRVAGGRELAASINRRAALTRAIGVDGRKRAGGACPGSVGAQPASAGRYSTEQEPPCCVPGRRPRSVANVSVSSALKCARKSRLMLAM